MLTQMLMLKMINVKVSVKNNLGVMLTLTLGVIRALFTWVLEDKKFKHLSLKIRYLKTFCPS